MKYFTLKAALFVNLIFIADTAIFANPTPLPPEKPFQISQNKGGGDSNSSADGPASSAVGGLTLEDRSYVREYHSKRKYPSVKYENDILVGHQLPESGSYYPIEGRESLNGYRYTVINDRTVLVDPATKRIIEIID